MKFPCTFCHVHQADLCNSAAGLAASPRSIEEMFLLGHCKTGTCPGCRCQIVDEVTDKASQRPVAKPGDPPPPRPFLFASLPHSTSHFNQKPGQAPLLPSLPLELWGICVLHLSLRIIGMLWEHCVLKDTTLNRKVSKRRGKHADDGTLASCVWALLTAAGVHIKVRGAPSNDINKYYHSIAKHSFAGSDASKLLSVWPSIMDLLYPLERRRADGTAQQAYQQWCACWEYWDGNVWPTIQRETSDRKDKARCVEESGKKFVELWTLASGGTKHLYPHMLVCHLPWQILHLPVDPIYMSLQSAEHRHSQRKDVAFRTNKKAPKDLADRVEYVMGYVRNNGERVKAHTRSAGKCRSFQTLRKMLLQDELENIFETPESLKIKHVRWLADRRRRRLRVLNNSSRLAHIGRRLSGGDLVLEDDAPLQVLAENDCSDSAVSVCSDRPQDGDGEDSTPPATDEDDV